MLEFGPRHQFGRQNFRVLAYPLKVGSRVLVATLGQLGQRKDHHVASLEG